MKNTYKYKRFYFLLSFTFLSVFLFGQKYTGLTAIASDGTTPTVIFDGNTAGGRWQDASNTDAAWITINLGSIKNINSIKIYWEAANAKAYDILVSTDNTNWTSIATKTNMAAGDRADIISGLNADCQYIKMQGVTRQLGYGYSIYEFEIYPAVAAVLTTLSVTPASTSIVAGATKQFSVAGFDQVGVSYALTNTTTWSVTGSGASIDANGLLSTTTKGLYTVTATNSGISQSTTIDVLPTGTNLSYVAGVSATATASSGTASLAFDNNSGSRWESAQSDPQWIEVDLGGNKTVTDIHLTWETANAKNYTIEASADNTNWTTVITKTNMAAGSRTDRLYDVNFTARYVRLTGTARTTGYGYSIWEFKIFGSSLIAPNLTFATPTSVTKNYGDAAFSNLASSSNSAGAISYSSGNTSVATVNPNTGEVTINAAGTAVITATIAANGGYSSTTATYTLTVNGINPDLAFATPTSMTKNYGDAAFINSASSSNSAGSISYSSGNTSVATINSSTGEVTIVAAGTAVITATIASNGSYNSTSVSYTLTVTGLSPDFSFSTSGTINKKLGNAAFTNAATSSNSTGTISYSSDNTGVATVNTTTGQVTIVGVGTSVISATISASGGYTSQTTSYTLVVKYPIGSIKGTNVPLYVQGGLGGDSNSPINTSVAVIDYKVVTKNGKSWVYTKFTGTGTLNLDASWMSQFRYWSVANAKTENWLTATGNAATKVVTGTATTTIPTTARISFFQSINGSWDETLITSYSPTTSNSPVAEDVTAPAVFACDAIPTETSSRLIFSGSDNSGDLFYHIEDATHNIDEFALEGTYTLSGLTLGTTYNLSITPIDFSGNEGAVFNKQFTCSSTVNIASSIAASAIPACSTCSMTIEDGAELTVDANTTLQNITVLPGAKITTQTGKTLAAGSLTLNSDATGTATFVDNGTTTITTANVQQYMTSGRNWYISSPVTNASSGALSTATSVVSYNEPTAAWITENASTLNPLKGYIAVTPQASSAITFAGTLSTGNKSITITRTPNVAKSGFNLVGNPYPSYLNWDLAYAASTNLQSSVWFRTKTVETSSVYTFDTYNAVDGVGTNNNLAASVTKYIPPMQAFWVRVAEGQTSGTMRVNNTMRTHRDISTNKFRAPAHADQQLIRLLVSNGVNKDEAIVLFNPNASDGFDEFDSQKMSNANAVIPEIYTTIGDQQLVINGLSTMTTDTELPLGFNTLQSNTFSIKASEISNFSSDVQIILKDKLLNTKTDLAGGAEYTFASDAINTTSRFSLLFRVPSVTTGLSNTENQLITIFRNQDNCISVNVSGNIGTDCYVSIYNALGQRLTSEKITTSKTVLKPQSGAGVYVVKVQNQGKDIIAKVTLN